MFSTFIERTMAICYVGQVISLYRLSISNTEGVKVIVSIFRN